MKIYANRVSDGLPSMGLLNHCMKINESIFVRCATKLTLTFLLWMRAYVSCCTDFGQTHKKIKPKKNANEILTDAIDDCECEWISD